MHIPILKLGEILLTSLPQDLTDSDTETFQADVLRKINRTAVRGLVIDISGMDVVDSFLARVLSKTVDMAGLIGVRAVVCGMQPSVALTLVEMRQDCRNIETALDLDHAMVKVRRLMSEHSE